MMSRFLAVLLLCVLTAGPVSWGQESLRIVERRIERAWDTVSTLVATVKMESCITRGPHHAHAVGEGHLEYMNASPPPK